MERYERKNRIAVVVDRRPGNIFFKVRKLTLISVIAFLFVVATGAHIFVSIHHDYHGLVAFLDRVFDLGLVTGLAAFTIAIGLKISRLLALSFANLAEEISFSLMLGTGCLGMLVLGLGLLGMLRPAPVVVLVLLCLLFSRTEVANLPVLARRVVTTCFATRDQTVLTALYLILVFILFIRTATPPWAIDEVIYHLPATQSFVNAGKVYPLYHLPLGNMPFLIHMIYALCLMAKADIAAKLFSLLLTLTTSLAVYAFCSRFLNHRVALVALFGFLAAGMVMEVGASTRIDVSLAGMLFLATYALIVYLESHQSKWLWTSAILSGFSLGIKLNAGLWIALMLIMLVTVSVFSNHQRLTVVAKKVVLFSAIATILMSPWLLKNLIWFHNPVYPFVTGELAEFGQNLRYFNTNDEKKLDAHFDEARKSDPERFEVLREKIIKATKESPRRHPLWFWEYYIHPNLYFMGDYHHYPNYLFLVLPLFLLVPRQKWLMWLLFCSVTFYFVAASTSWIARFLLPIYPSLTIISAYTLVTLTSRLTDIWASRLQYYIVLVCLLPPLIFTSKAISTFGNLQFILGLTSRSEFASNFFYYPPIDFINRNLPDNARVMSLGTEICYYLQPPYISDGTWDATEWRRLLIRNSSLRDVNQDLLNQGFTHIVFANWYFEFIAKTGWPKPGGSRFLSSARFSDPTRILEFGADYSSLRNWTTFDAYRRDFLELIYTDQNGYEVYRIKQR